VEKGGAGNSVLAKDGVEFQIGSSVIFLSQLLFRFTFFCNLVSRKKQLLGLVFS